jgi:hypothetical protein
LTYASQADKVRKIRRDVGILRETWKRRVPLFEECGRRRHGLTRV